MENVTDYKAAIIGAARVSRNLAKMAESDLASTEAQIKIIGDGKKGAKLVHVDGLTVWLDAYAELMSKGENKAARVINTTLNTASREAWECGTLGIQKIQGAFVFAVTPPKSDDDVDPIKALFAEILEATKGLSGNERAKMAEILRAKLA